MFQFMLDHPAVVVGSAAVLGSLTFVWALCGAAAIGDRRPAPIRQPSHVRLVPRSRPFDWAEDEDLS